MHFLLAMGRSGLFERWMINISSGLAWLYEGHDGGLSFWPDGPDQPGWRVAPPLNNRAFISDNQRMYHRVEAFGAGADATTLYFERDAELVADGEGWAVRSGGETIHRYRACEIRISLLWKAIMFKDADAARIHDEHLDDLSLGHAVEIMREEGHRRGIDIPHSADPLHDVDFTRALERAFPTRRTFAPVSIEV